MVWATLVAADVVGAWLAALLVDNLLDSSAAPRHGLLTSLPELAPFLIAVLAVAGAYAGRSALHRRKSVAASRIWLSLLLTGSALWGMEMTDRGAHSMTTVGLWLGATFILLLSFRWVGLWVLASVRPHRVAVVGLGELPGEVSTRLAARPDVLIVATLDVPDSSEVDWPDHLRALVAKERVDRVILSGGAPRSVGAAMRVLPRSVNLTVVRGCAAIRHRALVEELHGMLMVHAPSRPGRLSDAIKRAVDVSVAVACLLMLAPFLAVVAVAIRRTSPGPALFRQTRTGRGGKPFVILKFRTMREDAAQMREGLLRFNQAEPPLFKLEPDPRATPLGRHLRRTHLDELPQLFNVLRGHMSLVGPRPLPVEEAAVLAPWVPSRHDVRPGITGPWQTLGGTELSTEELCQLDESYVAAHPVAEDLRILARTLWGLVCALPLAAGISGLRRPRPTRRPAAEASASVQRPPGALPRSRRQDCRGDSAATGAAARTRADTATRIRGR
jgi:lipopolysaccharide/colanic/teichoic acid biosynthesis glycosyltransferase